MPLDPLRTTHMGHKPNVRIFYMLQLTCRDGCNSLIIVLTTKGGYQ